MVLTTGMVITDTTGLVVIEVIMATHPMGTGLIIIIVMDTGLMAIGRMPPTQLQREQQHQRRQGNFHPLLLKKLNCSGIQPFYH